jgi:hypothetical protein
MALNMGNAGNMQRLLDGRGWTLEQVTPVMQNLSESDLNKVAAALRETSDPLAGTGF